MPQLGHGPGGGLSLGMSSPVIFFAAFEAGPRGLPSLLVEAWSYVGQWLKGGIWPDLPGPSLSEFFRQMEWPVRLDPFSQ